jgi:hypothetical protein
MSVTAGSTARHRSWARAGLDRERVVEKWHSKAGGAMPKETRRAPPAATRAKRAGFHVLLKQLVNEFEETVSILSVVPG